MPPPTQPTGANQQHPSSSTSLTTTNNPTSPPSNHPSHTPSLAGSVIQAPDGLGGTSLIRIQNISSTANLGVTLNLKQIALKCRNTEYNPRRFAAVVMRIRSPRATALLFTSGKICITGTKSVHNSQLAAKKFAYIVERLGFTPQPFIDFQVHNVAGTADVGFPIRLEGLVYAHSTFASYEPELFPGLIYRLVSPRVVFLIFVSGKVVLTGARNEGDLAEAMGKIHPVLVEFRKASMEPMPGTSFRENQAKGITQEEGGGKLLTNGGEEGVAGERREVENV